VRGKDSDAGTRGHGDTGTLGPDRDSDRGEGITKNLKLFAGEV
jgi:hypothetical protein